MTNQHVSVAISGGGHRASLFGLGAMLYLIDAGKGPELSNVASVSGGSLTNGYMGLRTDLTTVTPGDFWDTMRPFAGQIARRGTLFAYLPTYLLIGAIILIGVPPLLFSMIVCPGALALVIVLVFAFLCGALMQLRGAVTAKSFDSNLFHGARLDVMNDSVSHVVCATELQAGLTAYFSGSFVYMRECGWGEPGDLPLARAVQSSAALPGAFNVVSLPVGRHNFTGDSPISHFKLTDGGVYDNMGTEWTMRLGERLREPGAPQSLPGADELIVVNASAGWRGVRKRPGLSVPLLGELKSLLAVKDVMYDQTTSVRRRWMDLTFRTAPTAPPGKQLRGAMVQIDRSPFDLPDRFAPISDDLGDRAKAAIAMLGEENRDTWEADAHANQGTKTTLSKIPPDRAISLIRHAYVLTMVNCHVLLDYPLPGIPDDDRFARLLD